MKLVMTAMCVAAIGLASLGAQAEKTESKTKVELKGGKEMLVTGCVESSGSGSGFMLTNVADKKGPQSNYMLLTHESDLAKQVGHRVQINGKVSDKGDAKIKTEVKSKTKVEHGKDTETSGKLEQRGNLAGTSYLNVDSVKMIAASCP